jgi:restriction system protein
VSAFDTERCHRGRSGDGGIDGCGTLQVNPLVSFPVLFQCKRYSKSVSPTVVRDLRGAMQGRAVEACEIDESFFDEFGRKDEARRGAPAPSAWPRGLREGPVGLRPAR